MSLRGVLTCLSAVVVLGMAGCSAAGPEEKQATTAPAAAATTTAAGDAVDAAAAKEVCAHLTKELPRIKAVGSEVGAMAQLTMSLAGFYEDHAKVADGTVLDAQTESACPQVKAEMLKATGMKSFADF